MASATSSKTAELSALQNSAQIEQNDEPPVQLSHAGDVVEFAFLKDVVGCFDFRGRNPQHLGCGIHDQADGARFHLDHDDSIFLAWLERLSRRIACARSTIGMIRPRRLMTPSM